MVNYVLSFPKTELSYKKQSLSCLVVLLSQCFNIDLYLLIAQRQMHEICTSWPTTELTSLYFRNQLSAHCPDRGAWGGEGGGGAAPGLRLWLHGRGAAPAGSQVVLQREPHTGEHIYCTASSSNFHCKMFSYNLFQKATVCLLKVISWSDHGKWWMT